MNIQEYIEKKKAIQNILLVFIGKDNDEEENYNNLIKLINDQKICEHRHEFKLFLYLILRIADNHYRTPNFFSKIERILERFKNEIKKFFTNSEIFNFFKNNKRILLYLIKDNIMEIDKSISSIMTEYKYEEEKYSKYFYPEMKPFMAEFLMETENFEEKRRAGENDNYICQLIRNDSIDEFISHVNQTNLSLSSKIKSSIFETNPFLVKKRPTLIEYSAFFGSIQIFRYLYLNKIQLTPSLWLYAIHSENPELIHILEENKIEPDDKSYEKCIEESIKCHHNEITHYIQNNLMIDKNKIESEFGRSVTAYSFHYYNYAYFPNNFDHEFIFYYLCQYDYFSLVDFLLKTRKINVNEKIISKQKYFLIKFLIQLLKSNSNASILMEFYFSNIF